MSYEYITKYNSGNYGHSGKRGNKGRAGGKKPSFITIHHWGIDGQKFITPINWLCRKNGTSSAHYVVEAGKVACLVDPENQAWHAGAKGNPGGIGIECRPECTPADRETVAELIAQLRKTYGNLPLYPHKKFMSTDCPGRWEAHLQWLSNRANQIIENPESTQKKEGVKVENKTDEKGTLAVFRLVNLQSGAHLFTISPEEVKQLTKGSWKFEGESFRVFPPSQQKNEGVKVENKTDEKGTLAVFRLVNLQSGAHLFTTSPEEVKQLTKGSWKFEGESFRVFPPQ